MPGPRSHCHPCQGRQRLQSPDSLHHSASFLSAGPLQPSSSDLLSLLLLATRRRLLNTAEILTLFLQPDPRLPAAYERKLLLFRLMFGAVRSRLLPATHQEIRIPIPVFILGTVLLEHPPLPFPFQAQPLSYLRHFFPTAWVSKTVLLHSL